MLHVDALLGSVSPESAIDAVVLQLLEVYSVIVSS
jgi:hypothetical protein